MIVTHSNVTYECDVAVKCENDNYIKLYKNGEEIAAFYNISDFTDYSISGGSFIDPCDCANPISLKTYAVKGCTIAPGNWINADDGRYYYEIENSLISGNTTTCNILLFFAAGTEFTYDATQEEGKIILYKNVKPDVDIVIDSIQITRV